MCCVGRRVGIFGLAQKVIHLFGIWLARFGSRVFRPAEKGADHSILCIFTIYIWGFLDLYMGVIWEGEQRRGQVLLERSSGMIHDRHITP
jgi:hypothetical protein